MNGNIKLPVNITKKNHKKNPREIITQPAFTCLKLTTETLEQGMKYVQS